MCSSWVIGNRIYRPMCHWPLFPTPRSMPPCSQDETGHDRKLENTTNHWFIYGTAEYLHLRKWLKCVNKCRWSLKVYSYVATVLCPAQKHVGNTAILKNMCVEAWAAPTELLSKSWGEPGPCRAGVSVPARRPFLPCLVQQACSLSFHLWGLPMAPYILQILALSLRSPL